MRALVASQVFFPGKPCLTPHPYNCLVVSLADGPVDGHVVASGGESSIIPLPYTNHAPAEAGAHIRLNSLRDSRTVHSEYTPLSSQNCIGMPPILTLLDQGWMDLESFFE